MTPPDADYRTPGQYIAALLEARGWSQRVLAIILNVNDSAINRLLTGKSSVDAQMAIALGELFGVTPERFLDLQSAYDLAKARVVMRPDPDRITRAFLFGDLPVGEMIKRGWIRAKDVRDTKVVADELARFFKAAS